MKIVRGKEVIAGWELGARIAADPPHVSLPWLWADYGSDGIGGPPVEDPLTIRVSLFLDMNRGYPVWETNLRDLAFEMIECTEGGAPRRFDASTETMLRKFSAALRQLADDFDAELAKPEAREIAK